MNREGSKYLAVKGENQVNREELLRNIINWVKFKQHEATTSLFIMNFKLHARPVRSFFESPKIGTGK